MVVVVIVVVGGGGSRSSNSKDSKLGKYQAYYTQVKEHKHKYKMFAFLAM